MVSEYYVSTEKEHDDRRAGRKSESRVVKLVVSFEKEGNIYV